jgi:hypothetical protein
MRGSVNDHMCFHFESNADLAEGLLERAVNDMRMATRRRVEALCEGL